MKRYIKSNSSKYLEDNQSLSKINAGYWEPDEDPEPLEDDPYYEFIELELDGVIINVSADGSWKFEDESTPWASSEKSKDGEWYGEEDDIWLADEGDMVDYATDLLEPRIPTEPGRYKILTYLFLEFIVKGVYMQRKWGEYGRPYVVDDGYRYTDDAEVKFNFKESYVESFKAQKID